MFGLSDCTKNGTLNNSKRQSICICWNWKIINMLLEKYINAFKDQGLTVILFPMECRCKNWKHHNQHSSDILVLGFAVILLDLKSSISGWHVTTSTFLQRNQGKEFVSVMSYCHSISNNLVCLIYSSFHPKVTGTIAIPHPFSYCRKPFKVIFQWEQLFCFIDCLQSFFICPDSSYCMYQKHFIILSYSIVFIPHCTRYCDKKCISRSSTDRVRNRE